VIVASKGKLFDDGRGGLVGIQVQSTDTVTLARQNYSRFKKKRVLRIYTPLLLLTLLHLVLYNVLR